MRKITNTVVVQLFDLLNPVEHAVLQFDDASLATEIVQEQCLRYCYSKYNNSGYSSGLSRNLTGTY